MTDGTAWDLVGNARSFRSYYLKTDEFHATTLFYSPDLQSEEFTSKEGRSGTASATLAPLRSGVDLVRAGFLEGSSA